MDAVAEKSKEDILLNVTKLEVEEYISTKVFDNKDRIWITNKLVRKYGETRKYETCFLSTGTLYIFRTK